MWYWLKGLLRRIRGVIGTALIWALGWAALLVGYGVALDPSWAVYIAIVGGIFGLIAGGGFAVVLSLAERRHTLEELSVWRTALWGAVGGALVCVCLMLDGPVYLEDFVIFGGMGAVFGAGTVAVAKRADTRERIRAAADSDSLLEGAGSPPLPGGDGE